MNGRGHHRNLAWYLLSLSPPRIHWAALSQASCLIAAPAQEVRIVPEQEASALWREVFCCLLTYDSVNSSSIRLVAIASSFPSIVISPLRSPSSLGYLVSQHTAGNMEGVKDEPLSQKVNLREKSNMPQPTPKSSAPTPSSPKKTAAEVQVKASQPTREATPPTSDALSPRSAQVQGEEDEDDDETDQDPIQEGDDDETMHDLQSYDWTKLEHEYELAMAQCDEKEKEATEEFRKLANVSFGVTSGVYEVKVTMC